MHALYYVIHKILEMYSGFGRNIAWEPTEEQIQVPAVSNA